MCREKSQVLENYRTLSLSVGPKKEPTLTVNLGPSITQSTFSDISEGTGFIMRHPGENMRYNAYDLYDLEQVTLLL